MSDQRHGVRRGRGTSTAENHFDGMPRRYQIMVVADSNLTEPRSTTSRLQLMLAMKSPPYLTHGFYRVRLAPQNP